MLCIARYIFAIIDMWIFGLNVRRNWEEWENVYNISSDEDRKKISMEVSFVLQSFGMCDVQRDCDGTIKQAITQFLPLYDIFATSPLA